MTCRYGGDIVGSVSQSEMQYEAKNYKRDGGWERGRGRDFMPKMFMIDISNFIGYYQLLLTKVEDINEVSSTTIWMLELTWIELEDIVIVILGKKKGGIDRFVKVNQEEGKQLPVC